MHIKYIRNGIVFIVLLYLFVVIRLARSLEYIFSTARSVTALLLHKDNKLKKCEIDYYIKSSVRIIFFAASFFCLRYFSHRQATYKNIQSVLKRSCMLGYFTYTIL